MKDLAVVILNYNGQAYLEKFLPSVVKYSTDAKIYVIDNASTDDSIKFLEDNYQNINLILLKENLGYAGGYNAGLEIVHEKILVLLNSDIEVTENWLDPLYKTLKASNDIVACQPKILDFYNKDHFEYAGASGGFLDYLGYAFCRGRLFDTLEPDNKQYNEPIEIFWATGACLAIKNENFKRLGGFDADFFAHMEEIDLCWRLKNKGHKIVVCPNSVVLHVGGGTLNKENPFKTFLNYRNNLALIFKNLPFSKLTWVLPLRLILDGVSAIKFLKEGQFSSIWAIIRAHFAFYAMIPSLMKKRGSDFLATKYLYQKSIVLQYFLFKKRKFTEL